MNEGTQNVVQTKNIQSKQTQNKKSEEEIKSSPLYKNLLNQLEVCRGTNVSLSNKISKLEETVKIQQSKNLYLQEENQRVKLVNEGLSGNSPASNISPVTTNCSSSSSSETSARVVILENENITNKINKLG